jgi:glutathione peroxidase
MKLLSIPFVALFIWACSESNTVNPNLKAENTMSATTSQAKSFHDFVVTDIDGNDFDLSQLKGKRVLVVNVASKCGFTSQYKDLQELYEQYGGDNFTIIGFPANNFMGQEPGDEEEIKSFCQRNYGVSFPMMSKISVKGKDIHPVYQWLTSRELNNSADYSVKWNFHKFLIDENGQIVTDYGSRTSPISKEIVSFASGE